MMKTILFAAAAWFALAAVPAFAWDDGPRDQAAGEEIARGVMRGLSGGGERYWRGDHDRRYREHHYRYNHRSDWERGRAWGDDDD